jgi:hypothetical protein
VGSLASKDEALADAFDIIADDLEPPSVDVDSPLHVDDAGNDNKRRLAADEEVGAVLDHKQSTREEEQSSKRFRVEPAESAMV